MIRTASLVRRAGLAPALVVLALAGCKAPCPPPCPLVPSAIHAEVARERTLPLEGSIST